MKADCLTRSVCLGTVLLKDEELARYLEHGKKQLLHWFWLSLDNCQTGVDRFCLANWHHQFIRDFDWTLMMCERILLQSFCLLQQLWCTVSYYRYVICWVNIFSSSNYIMLPSLDKYFFDYNFQRLNLGWQFESCVADCSRSSWEWRFLEDIFHKVGWQRV